VDPDFLVGWEVQLSSLGYLLERAPHLQINDMYRRLSRLRAVEEEEEEEEEEGREEEGGREEEEERREAVEQVGEGRVDEWGEEHQSGIWVLGESKREGGREGRRKGGRDGWEGKRIIRSAPHPSSFPPSLPQAGISGV